MMYDDVYIELLEEFPCSDKKTLLRREGEHIRQNENCVNRSIAGRTNQEWLEENREHVKNYSKQYEATRRNRPERKEYMKKYLKEYAKRTSSVD